MGGKSAAVLFAYDRVHHDLSRYPEKSRNNTNELWRCLARLHRAGELVPVRIPSEADERVRDVVRCRDTFQREILTSRHSILKFLAMRGRNACKLTPLTPAQSHQRTSASASAALHRSPWFG